MLLRVVNFTRSPRNFPYGLSFDELSLYGLGLQGLGLQGLGLQGLWPLDKLLLGGLFWCEENKKWDKNFFILV